MNSVEALLEEVFHGLHVVVGHGLDVFHALRVGLGEVAVDVAQLAELGAVNPLELGQRNFAQGDEILHLHIHAVANEGVF